MFALSETDGCEFLHDYFFFIITILSANKLVRCYLVFYDLCSSV